MSNYTKATDFAAKDALLSGDPAKVIKGTEIDTEYNAIAVAVSTKVDSVSPTFTGTPAAPTATPGTNTTQIATTAFVTAADTAAVTAERSATVTLTNKTINLANNTLVATSAQVAAAVTDETGTGALVFATSPALAGTPTSPTASPGTNTTQVATTAFVEAAKTAIFSAIYPVGSIYTNATNSTNPGTLLGFGTWTAFGAGRVMVGFNASDTLFDTAEETGGSKDAIVVTHTHTATSTVTDPGHTHGIHNDNNNNNGLIPNGGDGSNSSTTTVDSNVTGISVATTISSTGSSGTNANLPPYITVYMWKRTA